MLNLIRGQLLYNYFSKRKQHDYFLSICLSTRLWRMTVLYCRALPRARTSFCLTESNFTHYSIDMLLCRLCVGTIIFLLICMCVASLCVHITLQDKQTANRGFVEVSQTSSGGGKGPRVADQEVRNRRFKVCVCFSVFSKVDRNMGVSQNCVSFCVY